MAVLNESASWEGVENRHPQRTKVSVGASFGLHNMAIAAPQIIAALVCSVLFTIFGVLEVEDSFGWVLRCAGLAGLVAAWMSWGLDSGVMKAEEDSDIT